MKRNLIATIALLGLATLGTRAELLVYEPFNYTPVNDEVNGLLAGKNGGIGWDAAWVDSADSGFAFIYDSRGNPADLYGGTFGLGDPNWDGVIDNLPQVGNYVGLSDWNSEPLGQSRLNAYRRLASSAGSMAGDNGGVLWLSMGVHFANNAYFVTPTVMLTTTDSYLQERGRTLSGSGAGLGTALGNDFNSATLTKDLNPLFMAAGVQTVKTTGVDILAASRPDLTVILKFEFGDPNDTVRVWYFGEGATMDEATFDANAIAATSSIDESTLNTLTYAIDRKANAIDEIRIGTSFTDVITLPPPGPVDIAVSTVSASPLAVSADGTTTSTISVTLKDAIGIPIQGKDVTLANTAGPQAAIIDPVTSVTTDANGLATFTVKSSTAGVEEFTATNTTDSLVITQTASVTFVNSADADLSTVAASPSYVNADGTTTSTITVTLIGLGGFPVAGKDVTLTNTAGPQAAVISPPGTQTSDSNGQVIFTVKSSTPGTEVFTATDTTDSVVVTQTASVAFVGPADVAVSTVAASPNAVVANGSLTSTITVTLKDAAGLPVQGDEVTLANTSGPQAAVIDPVTAVTTDVNGVATFTVSSSTPGTEVFTATDTTDSLVITQTASVEFVDPSAPLAFNVNLYASSGNSATWVPQDPATLEGPAGGLGQTWNQFNTTTGSGLFSSTGVVTGAGFTNNVGSGWLWGNPDLSLLKAGRAQFGKGADTTHRITGLTPGTFYHVWIASYADNAAVAERAVGEWSTSNATTTLGPQVIDTRTTLNGASWEYGLNYVLFEYVEVDANGEIVLNGDAWDLTLDAGDEWRLPLNGFQLVPTVAPIAMITSFGIPGSTGVIDEEAKTISLVVPTGTNLATFAPFFTITSGTSNQTSGATPSPTFAAQNPVPYVVTDTSTDPDTENTYQVTVTVAPGIGTLVIDLGAGTTIEGGTYGLHGTTLPLPTLPAGSILRSIAVDTVLTATDNENFASDLSVLLDPTPATPGEDFAVEITSGDAPLGGAGALKLGWPAEAAAGPVTPLVDTKTDADWATAGPIDLSTAGLFLGNAHGGPTVGGTWSGTITLTYDIAGGGSAYSTWSGGAAFGGDKNGDGVSNGLAFLLGSPDADENALGKLPEVSQQAGGLGLTFSILNAANRGPAVATVQWSNDLGITDPWTTVPVPETTGTFGGVRFVVTPNGKLNDVVATIPAGEAAGGMLFGRLSGTEN